MESDEIHRNQILPCLSICAGPRPKDCTTDGMTACSPGVAIDWLIAGIAMPDSSSKGTSQSAKLCNQCNGAILAQSQSHEGSLHFKKERSAA